VSRNLINDDDFRSRNRTEDRYFTRCRKLTFVFVILLLLRKSAKSIQCVVNELFMVLGLESVTAAAFSQARKRIRHTAFIELNEQAIVNVMYRDGEYLRYKGFRVLAIDGSKIRLPETEEINKEFGQVAYTNGQNEEIKGYHTYAQGSVLYSAPLQVVEFLKSNFILLKLNNFLKNNGKYFYGYWHCRKYLIHKS